MTRDPVGIRQVTIGIREILAERVRITSKNLNDAVNNRISAQEDERLAKLKYQQAADDLTRYETGECT